MPLAEPHSRGLISRLNRIEGQIRGIRRMIEEPRHCSEILQQLAAAEAALNRVSLGIIKYHVEVCVPAAVQSDHGEGTKSLAELVDIFDRFTPR
jgi:DNA-binding FrmR family transcriptional regulator